MRTLIVVLASALHAAAWNDCEFPTVEHFSIDEGAGKSYSYAVGAMNGKTYIGGYSQGSLILQGLSQTEEFPPPKSAVSLGKPFSGDITLYVAEVASTGETEKLWSFENEPPQSTRDTKIHTQGLHSVLDNNHMAAIGSYKGKLHLPDGTTWDSDVRMWQPAIGRNQDVAVPFVVKIDVNKANGIGPGTTGWAMEVDTLDSGFPGGAQVYSVDGDSDGNILISFSGCKFHNATCSMFQECADCAYYISMLAAADGAELWTNTMPTKAEKTGEVHGVDQFVRYSPCRLLLDKSFFCSFHMDANEEFEFDNGVALSLVGEESQACIAKFDSLGNALWAKGVLESPGTQAMSVNEDGSLLAISARNPDGPAWLARIDTSAGNEGNLLWKDAAGVGSHGVRDVMVTWNKNAARQEVIGFGQIQGPFTLTDTAGFSTTINTRGSYEVFIVNYVASDGSGRYAFDGGGTGLEYFFDIAMDLQSGAMVIGGGVGYGAVELRWGNLRRNHAFVDEKMKAFAVKFSTKSELPSCLTSCQPTMTKSDVKAGHCYVDRHCYAANETAPYVGSECMKCNEHTPLQWSAPNVTEHCFIDDMCVAEGVGKPVSRGVVSDCETCDPSVRSNAYSLKKGFKMDANGGCMEKTWEMEAHDNGWKPCSTKTARRLGTMSTVPAPARRLRRLAEMEKPPWDRAPGSTDDDAE